MQLTINLRGDAVQKEKSETFDSNTITPGTPFMDRLATALQYYVHKRLNTDPGWKGVEVILSDSNTPGEGEHKAMSYVRQMRGRPGWNPNTKHVVYGLDADLIMLSLATHEPHFTILREVVFPTQNNDPKSQVRAQFYSRDDPSKPVEIEQKPEIARKPYQMLQVNILREYLALEMRVPNLPFPFDLERVIDDFVFMCFFVGNDFLPHMPTLDIREGAIELMMRTYKTMLPELGGYMAHGSTLNLERVEKFIQTIGALEDTIFQKRMRDLKRQKDRVGRQKADKLRDKQRKSQRDSMVASNAAPSAAWQQANAGEIRPVKDSARNAMNFSSIPGPVAPPGGPPALGPTAPSADGGGATQAAIDNKAAAARLRAGLVGKHKEGMEGVEGLEPAPKKARGEGEVDVADAALADAAAADAAGGDGDGDTNMEGAPADDDDAAAAAAGRDTTMDAAGDEDDEISPEQMAMNVKAAAELKETLDEMMKEKADCFDLGFASEAKIRLDEEGWKARYYQEKLGVPEEEQAGLVRGIVQAYVEGLCWVMRYYYDGVASWRWFFPYHYAPFASDLVNLTDIRITFEPGQPFSPFNQLMGVLPAASQAALPEPFRWLFTSPKSPILDFYPTEFAVDMNGKRFAWQGVVLLPWIDEARLMAATNDVLPKLTNEEKRRNGQRMELLYVHSSHTLAPVISELEYKWGHLSEEERAKGDKSCIVMDPEASNHMHGTLLLAGGVACPSVMPAPFGLGENVRDNKVMCGCYRLPPSLPHQPMIMPGTELGAPVLTDADTPQEEPLWHEKQGGGGGGRGGYGGGRGAGRHNGMHMGDAAQRTISHAMGGRGGGGGGGYQQGGYGGGGGYQQGGYGAMGGGGGGQGQGGGGYGLGGGGNGGGGYGGSNNGGGGGYGGGQGGGGGFGGGQTRGGYAGGGGGGRGGGGYGGAAAAGGYQQGQQGGGGYASGNQGYQGGYQQQQGGGYGGGAPGGYGGGAQQGARDPRGGGGGGGYQQGGYPVVVAPGGRGGGGHGGGYGGAMPPGGGGYGGGQPGGAYGGGGAPPPGAMRPVAGGGRGGGSFFDNMRGGGGGGGGQGHQQGQQQGQQGGYVNPYAALQRPRQ
ncbi:hypothetical protein FOA52_010736 [Chlamydomonas sp. UWO 241]|nr:hypothetical protein FOA52_010736 [Chlamydomonas sp. UWO 241]